MRPGSSPSPRARPRTDSTPSLRPGHPRGCRPRRARQNNSSPSSYSSPRADQSVRPLEPSPRKTALQALQLLPGVLLLPVLALVLAELLLDVLGHRRSLDAQDPADQAVRLVVLRLAAQGRDLGPVLEGRASRRLAIAPMGLQVRDAAGLEVVTVSANHSAPLSPASAGGGIAAGATRPSADAARRRPGPHRRRMDRTGRGGTSSRNS